MHVESRSLLLLLIASTVAFGYVVWPLSGAIMWGTIVALVFTPLHRRLLSRLPVGASGVAFLTLCIVLLMVILPLLAVFASLAREAADLYEMHQSGELMAKIQLEHTFASLPHWCRTLLDRLGLTTFGKLQRSLLDLIAQGSRFAATHLFSFGQDAVEFSINFFVALYLAFFAIRDGDAIHKVLYRAIPLDPRHKDALLSQFTLVIRATVKGSLVVAAVQGALGGVAFLYLGVEGAMLLAVLMAVLSLLPAFGASLVWLPVAAYLLATGAWLSSAALVVYGVLVIGLVDNLLRPMLVGHDTKMPDYVVMVSTLGGVVLFGLNGLILGPVIAAMFLAVWRIHLVKTAPASLSVLPH